MRYKPMHKETTRAHLLEAAGALVKKQGFAATGVDSLMAAAGLTSGAFYSHFHSKSELLGAVIENELKHSIALFSDKSLVQGVASVEAYLDPAHVAHPESGCVIPSLAPEIARASKSTQKVFEKGVLELKDQIKLLVKDEAKSWSIMVQLVGAVMVARGIDSEQTRKNLLNGVAKQVKQILEQVSMES